jgi:ABC-type multidrug transport system ATPase subunit
MGIVGPNGAGKSTFFKILAGLEEADSGQLILNEDSAWNVVTLKKF